MTPRALVPLVLLVLGPWLQATCPVERASAPVTQTPQPRSTGAPRTRPSSVPGVSRREVVGTKALSGDRFTTRDGAWVRVLGIQAPSVAPGTGVVSRQGKQAQERLDELVRGLKLTLEFGHVEDGRDRGTSAAHVLLADGRLLAAVLLSEGLARPALVQGDLRHADALVRAWQQARKARVGLHADRTSLSRLPPLAFHRGFSMGLYSRDPHYDYRPMLDALGKVHASHLLLVVPWFMQDWTATLIKPVESRTPPFATVERACRQARKRGIRVCLMPIVLLRTGTKDHWRGDIKPSSPMRWWRNYTGLVGRFADLAEECGVSMLSVGSEFSSLELEEQRWRTLIRTVRLRYGGQLTYSANWDHYESVTFWDALDRAGMTAYHSLTKKDDPSIEEIVAAWQPIRDRLLEFQKRIGRPLFFTEVGYASQDGINKDPWNYYISEKPDWQEQADCFRGFIRAWDKAGPEFGGAYFYNWWKNHDKDDRTNYSIRGKPGEQVISRWFRRKARRDGPAARPR